MEGHVLQVCRTAPSGQNVRNLEKNKKAKALWSFDRSNVKGIDFYDLGSVQEIQTRSQVSLDLWAIHLKSRTAALADADAREVEQVGHRPPPQVEAMSFNFLSWT